MTDSNKTTAVAAPLKGGLALIPQSDIGKLDYGGKTGKQVEISKADFIKPVLTLLQGQSPYIVDPEQKVKGAEAGMLYDPSTGNLYDGKVGIPLVLSFFIHTFDEWFPRKKREDGTVGKPMPDGRKKGRSLKREDPVVVAAVAEARRLSKDPAAKRKWYERRFPDTNNDMIETVCLYGLAIRKEDPLIFDPILFPMSSTKLASWSDYFAKLARFKNPVTGKEPPFCSHVARLSVVSDKDDDGNVYYTTVIKPYNGDLATSLLDPNSVLFDESAKFSYEVADNHLWRLDEIDLEGVAAEAQTGPSATFRGVGGKSPDMPAGSGEGEGNGLF